MIRPSERRLRGPRRGQYGRSHASGHGIDGSLFRRRRVGRPGRRSVAPTAGSAVPVAGPVLCVVPAAAPVGLVAPAAGSVVLAGAAAVPVAFGLPSALPVVLAALVVTVLVASSTPRDGLLVAAGRTFAKALGHHAVTRAPIRSSRATHVRLERGSGRWLDGSDRPVPAGRPPRSRPS